MPSLEVWGPAVWTLFHTLAERVHEDAYPFIAKQLFEQIVRICKVLPCPDCSTDASIFLTKINVSTLKTKREFKNLIYLFHNYVNAKKRKPLFNVLGLKRYENYKLVPVVNNFLINFNTKGNMNLINESFQRSLVQNNFKKWLVINLRAFTAPIVQKPNIIVQEIVISEQELKQELDEELEQLDEELEQLDEELEQLEQDEELDEELEQELEQDEELEQLEQDEELDEQLDEELEEQVEL